MQTERVTFLTSVDHKAALDAFAASRGKSVGHVVREATNRYMAQTTDEDDELAALVAEVNAAMPRMMANIDAITETLRSTRERVEQSLEAVGFTA